MTIKEFAKKNNISVDEIVFILQNKNYPFDGVDDEINSEILSLFLNETKELAPRIRDKKKQGEGEKKGEKKRREEPTRQKIVSIPLIPMTVADLGNKILVSSASIISFFLQKKKNLYSANTLLSTDEILFLSQEFAFQAIPVDKAESLTIEKRTEQFFKKKYFSKEKDFEKTEKKRKIPVVTITGHVDHGKTTLLDVIRNKNIAAQEKGGITQHVGAYLVNHNGRQITFIDTPGHAAFTTLRERGVTVADITIVAIAFDDGVMEQTIESMKIARAGKSSIIIAITKIDKNNNKKEAEVNFDHIYQKLSQHEIMVEPWGGDIPVVPLSAKKNQGINELLDVILIIDDMLLLEKNSEMAANGFLLETSIKKGLGTTSTIIINEGRLSVGDFFITEYGSSGKVVSLHKDGKSVTSGLPGEPLLLSGFDSLPKPGDLLHAVAKDEYQSFFRKKIGENKLKEDIQLDKNRMLNHNLNEEVFAIIIKGDSISSIEAIQKAINAMKEEKKLPKRPILSRCAIGNITKGDIDFAKISNAPIYVFNVIVSKDIEKYSQKNGVMIHSFPVIYHLLDDIEKKIKDSVVKTVAVERSGELIVLKIFKIKSIGIIIGFKVAFGKVKLGSEGFVLRAGKKIGKIKITNLQQERVDVKEIGKGAEGAAIMQGFSQEWNIGDVIILQ